VGAGYELVVWRDLKVLLRNGAVTLVPQINTPVVWEYVFDTDRFRRDFFMRSNRSTSARYFVSARFLSASQECVEVRITVREADPGDLTMSYVTHSVKFMPA
jgi:hypothetical protein